MSAFCNVIFCDDAVSIGNEQEIICELFRLVFCFSGPADADIIIIRYLIDLNAGVTAADMTAAAAVSDMNLLNNFMKRPPLIRIVCLSKILNITYQGLKMCGFKCKRSVNSRQTWKKPQERYSLRLLRIQSIGITGSSIASWVASVFSSVAGASVGLFCPLSYEFSVTV